MKIKSFICCLGLTLCLCSCGDDKGQETPPEVQETDENTPETEPKVENLDYAKEFSELTPQSSEESEQGFLDFHTYITEARSRAIRDCKGTNVFGDEYTAQSIDHTLLKDSCEYEYSEDYHKLADFVPDDYNDQRNTWIYSYEKKSADEYSISSTSDYTNIAWEISNGTYTQTGLENGSGTVVDTEDTVNYAVCSIGLANRLLDIRFDNLELTNVDMPFNETKDACTEVYFKVTEKEAVVRVRYNILFRDYYEPTGGARMVYGTMGYTEEKNGPFEENQFIGQITQEIKFSNYLLTYHNVYTELKGKTDNKIRFARTK